MRFLTYNAGLLDFQLFGRSLVKPADWIEERFAALPKAILELDPDVLTLQEIYDSRHKQQLWKELSKRYPYATISPLRGPSFVPASLLTLSKWPMANQGFFRFKRMPIAEQLIDNKGFLLSRVNTPQGELLIANVHTTAGGSRHPEHPKTDGIRARQIDQLLAKVAGEVPVLLAGDFNCGSVSPDNYRQLTQAGYLDVWHALQPADTGWTWEPTSILNAGGVHSDWGCPAQRIDLVLLDRKAAQTFTAQQAHRVFMEESVRLNERPNVTLSDHYGVLVDLA